MQEITGTARSRVRLDRGRVGASRCPAPDDAVRLEPRGCGACRHAALAAASVVPAPAHEPLRTHGLRRQRWQGTLAAGSFPYSLGTPSMSPADNRSDPTGIPGGGIVPIPQQCMTEAQSHGPLAGLLARYAPCSDPPNRDASETVTQASRSLRRCSCHSLRHVPRHGSLRRRCSHRSQEAR